MELKFQKRTVREEDVRSTVITSVETTQTFVIQETWKYGKAGEKKTITLK